MNGSPLRLEEAPHFAIFAFCQIQLDYALRSSGGNQPRLLRLEFLALVPYATREPLQHLRLDAAFDRSDIFFVDPIARMSQMQTEFTIVGQENQTLAVEIQPANRMKMAPFLGQQSVNRWPAQVILARTDQA